MAELSAAELQVLLERDVPGSIAPTTTAVPASQSNGATPHHGDQSAALLQTNDTLVESGRLPEVAAYLRDRLGYTYLSNITVVDYLSAGLFEIVYHFYSLEGGPPLVIKTRVSREQPAVPSLCQAWPGANLQEREAYDLYGIVFVGHPFMRRVYMWDEFEGFPMRKDFPKQGDKYLSGEDAEE